MNVYILDENHEPVPCESDAEWGMWMCGRNKIVEQSQVGEIKVSTVFLGMDHSFSGGDPTFFETMIFGGPLDQNMWRYRTWEEAVTGHAEALKLVGGEKG